jgi:hypothetical protein
MTDFGADHSFVTASAKLKEHYGIAVPVSAIQTVTEKHGETILAGARSESDWPERPGVAVLIAETDGSFIPVVEMAELADDRRKTRTLMWKEARLSLAHKPGSVTPFFGATMGNVDKAGQQLRQCAIRAGAGRQTKLHCVGDGASWITDQVDLQFGTQARYLIDFFHLCEYLSAAGERIAGEGKKAWVQENKERLKDNRWQDVLESLAPFCESDTVADADAPVRSCHRYIRNRPDYLDYKNTLAEGLPIGSGEIESAHRHVIQKRLKIAGAWWKTDNADKMLALRVLRANGDWNRYWNDFGQKVA